MEEREGINYVNTF